MMQNVDNLTSVAVGLIQRIGDHARDEVDAARADLDRCRKSLAIAQGLAEAWRVRAMSAEAALAAAKATVVVVDTDGAPLLCPCAACAAGREFGAGYGHTCPFGRGGAPR